MKHCTTIEQSKKLLELGLSRDTADMFYSHKTVFYNMMEHRLYVDEDDDWYLHQRNEIAFMDTGNEIPCWSLGALLEVMPKIKEFYYPSLYKSSFSVTACMYSTQEHDVLKIYTGEDFLESAYSMVVWLLENGYIKKEPKTSSE